MRKKCFILILVAAMVGCQTLPSHDCAPCLPNGAIPQHRSQHSFPTVPAHYAKQSSTVEPAVAEELLPAPGPDLSLSDAFAIVLLRNPDWITTLQSRPVNQAALEVAKRYPYAPTAQLQMAPSPRETNGNTAKTFTQVALSQTFELGGQRRHRWQSGVAQLDRTDWQIQQAAVLTVAETQRRFFTAIYQAELRDVQQSMAELNERLLGVIQRRFEAGQASAADVALARIEARSTAQQAAVAKTRQVGALQSLRTQLGLDVHVSLGINRAVDLRALISAEMVAALPEQPSDDSDQVEAKDSWTHIEYLPLTATRPDVLAAEADLRLAESQLNLAQANLVPNVQLGPYFERDEGDTQFWGIVAQMQLGNAYTSHGTAAVRQRYAELQRQRVALDQLVRKARLEIAAAARHYAQARRVVEDIGLGNDEELSHEVQRVEDLYNAGQVDLVRVFAARKAMLQFRTSRAEAVNELGQAAADLIEATGVLPEAITLSGVSNEHE